MRPNAQIEADSEPVSGLLEWIKRQPTIRSVSWARDVEQRVVDRLRRGLRFSDTEGPVEPGEWLNERPSIRFLLSRHLPEGTVAAFDEHGVLVGMVVL